MKSNLLKSIFCGLILTTILGSGVYAETVSYNRYGYNDDDIYEVIGGDAGRYLVDGTSTTLSITATSKSTSSKLYKVRVEQRYYRDNTLWDMHADSAVLKKGDDNISHCLGECTAKGVIRSGTFKRYRFNVLHCKRGNLNN